MYSPPMSCPPFTVNTQEMTNVTDHQLTIWAVAGIPEIEAGVDLTSVIGNALEEAGGVVDGDIIAVSSKIISKAEGRQVRAADREQAITDETVRVVATRIQPSGSITRIVENRLGVVGAAAGVDASNVPEGIILLLPIDPDASARALCVGLRLRFGAEVGIVVTDTLGRPWRLGQTDVAIGAAGLTVVDDLRGTVDAAGRKLDVTVTAVADEIAAATDLVKRKSTQRPVAVVRGLAHLVGDLEEPGARSLVRTGPSDMFRVGSDEAYDEGYAAGFQAASDADRES